MKKGLRNFVLGTMLISTIVSPVGNIVTKAEGVATETEAEAENEKNEKFADIRPQDDFYGYMNAAFLRNAKYDPKYGYGSFEDCEYLADTRMDELIDKIVAEDEHTSTDAKLIKSYYQQVIDYSGNNSNADSDLENARKEIEGISSMQELMEMLGKYDYEYGVHPVNDFSISKSFTTSDQYSLGFSGIDSILEVPVQDIAESREGRSALRDKVRNMLINLGYDKQEASISADNFTAMAVDIAFHKLDKAQDFDGVVICNTEEIKQRGFDIDSFTRGFGVENPYDEWLISSVDQFMEMTEKLSDEKNLENFKIWLLLDYVISEEFYLSDKYRAIHRMFGEETKQGDMLGKYLVKKNLTDSLGRLYKEAYYTKEKEEKVRAMCEDIRQSYRELISKADWLSQDGRDKLLSKLENIEFKLGGESADGGMIDLNLLGADAYETGKNLIRSEWNYLKELLKTKRPKCGDAMPSQQVNADFWVDNVVVIPAAIQDGPFFDENRSEYANLGGLGELFKKINKEKGISILQVTHSEKCAEYGDRIVRLDGGRTE